MIANPAKFDLDLATAIRAGISRPPRSFSTWLESAFWILDGPRRGRFSFDSQPITRLFADAIDSGQFAEIVCAGPSQSGKSLIGYVAPLLYHACELQENLVFGVPLEEMAGDKWEADLRPAMDASPELRRLLPERGAGSGGGTIRDLVKLANGALLKIATAGGDDANKAGFTARVVCVTEAARFSQIGEHSVEADPLRQLRARQRSYPRENRRTYIEGTLTLENELPWTLRKSSTQSRIVVNCPNCGRWVRPGRACLVGWQNAATEIEAAERATWTCPECRDPIDESQRRAALIDARLVHDGQSIDRRGDITGPGPQSSRLWFHYGAFHNVFLSAADLAVDCWVALQSPPDTPESESAQRELSQFVFADCYIPPKIVETVDATPDQIAQRRIKLPRSILPDDVATVTIGVDCGEKTGYWLALATRSSQSAHIVDYGRFDVPLEIGSADVALSQALAELWAQLSVGYATGDGQRVGISAALVDSGFMPDSVFRFVRQVAIDTGKPQLVLPVLGRGETQLVRQRYFAPKKKTADVRQIDSAGRWHLARNRRAGVWQVTADVDRFKQLATSALSAPLGTPGSISLFAGPRSIHSRIAQHFAAERLIVEELPGKPPRQRWIRTGANHWLDCLVYALIAANRLGYSPQIAVDDQVASGPHSIATDSAPKPAFRYSEDKRKT